MGPKQDPKQGHGTQCRSNGTPTGPMGLHAGPIGGQAGPMAPQASPMEPQAGPMGPQAPMGPQHSPIGPQGRPKQAQWEPKQSQWDPRQARPMGPQLGPMGPQAGVVRPTGQPICPSRPCRSGRPSHWEFPTPHLLQILIFIQESIHLGGKIQANQAILAEFRTIIGSHVSVLSAAKLRCAKIRGRIKNNNFGKDDKLAQNL